jgi:hypothetical protein
VNLDPSNHLTVLKVILFLLAILPFSFTFTHTIQGSNQLTGDRKPGKTPQIPLQVGFAKLADFFTTRSDHPRRSREIFGICEHYSAFSIPSFKF